MYKRSSNFTGGAHHAGEVAVTQAEYIAERLLTKRGSYATQAEWMQRQRARVTLRYFAFERACGVRHTYTDNGR